MPNKVIAHELKITESTVKVFVRRILMKLGASNRTEAASLTRGP
jgi:DNA-binding NarL/FixJ family response regulator